jgi:hypothetical protein
MDGINGDRILRCSDGHFFTMSEVKRLFGTMHLGPKRILRCPIDGRWRLAGNVRACDLTQEQLAQARSHRA